MELYPEMRNRHQTEFNAFPCFFAFSDWQFEEGMKKLNLDPVKDIDKIYSGPGGMIYKRSDSKTLKEMIDRHSKELQNAIQNSSGEVNDFLFSMFKYELANHEYSYTYDYEDTLDALDMTLEEINADPNKKRAFNLARKYVLTHDC